MTVFAAAIDALFRDSHMAADATYTPAGGDPVTVRAIRMAPDIARDFYGAQIHSDTVVIEVRVSEVAAPAAGDAITFDGEDRVVQGVPTRDDHRTVWLLDTRPA